MEASEFDVFFAHNGRDKPLVRELKRLLVDSGLNVWLDEDELRPGFNWQPLLESGVRSSKSVVVLIGRDGLGPWEDEEMQGALRLAIEEKRPVIPALLPGCPREPSLPLFLGNRTWVDLADGYGDASIQRLIWGITGHPLRMQAVGSETTSTMPAEIWPVPAKTPNGDTGGCYEQLNKLCATGTVPKGETRKRLWFAVRKDRPSCFRDWQLANIARWCAPEYLEVEERFTSLQVNVRVQESAEGPAEKLKRPFDTLEHAMEAVFDEFNAPASVIFAPPGGGKSTLLRHYQLNQAKRLGGAKRLVFYVQLRDYRLDKISAAIDAGIDSPAMNWLESEWRKETRESPPLLEFMRQGSLTVLLDGLNEIPRRSEDEYRARVDEWRELMEIAEHTYPGVCFLFACRPLDYSQRLDAGRHMRLPEIEIQEMEPDRIRAFIHKRFASDIATQIWGQLEHHPSLQLYGTPYYLNLLLGQIDIEAPDVAIPQNRAELFSGMVRERLRRECQKRNPRFDNSELLSRHDRRTIENDRSRGNRLPKETPLFAALAALAFHIQDDSGSNDRWGILPWDEACEAMRPALRTSLPAVDCLEAGYDLGLFEDDAAQAGDVRFIHQQMQEYFAAWVLAQEPLARLAMPWRSVDLAESTETLLKRGGHDDLPELSITGWEESALIASSVSKDPEAFIRALIPVNLALAGRCAAQTGLKVSTELQTTLRNALLARSQDRSADLRARIAAGKALGELGDPRLRFNRPRNNVVIMLPTFTAIQGGEYTIGGDPEGHQDEQPERYVQLSDFELAVHPVTNAEYACFIKAGGYREDSWWPGRALAWRNGELGQDAIHQDLRENRHAIIQTLGAAATAEEIRDQYDMSLASGKWWQERICMVDAEFEAWLSATFPRPDGPFFRPKLWASLTWGNAAQPVVGVCWYEAQAYCRWLNGLLANDRYRLPSEAEWEAAGRGREKGRRYAWGGQFDLLRANTAKTRLGVTTPVGVFPDGNTPGVGLQDLCGNVWEWTATPWSEGEVWHPELGSAVGQPDARRVVRGGSWRLSASRVRLGSRDAGDPDLRDDYLGFRLCRGGSI